MPDDVDYPVNRSDANDPEPDNSEATQDRRHATTSIFDDRYTVEEKRRRGDNRPVNEARPDDRSGGGRYGETARDNRSGDRRNDQDNRAGDRRDGRVDPRHGDDSRSGERRYDSIAAAPSEEAVKVSMEARRKMTQAAKRTIDQSRTQSPDIRNSINSSFPSEDM